MGEAGLVLDEAIAIVDRGCRGCRHLTPIAQRSLLEDMAAC